ncbi:MAG: hypothetical protein OIF32_08820 [Campylobacterales bacterium]|nr:hypothetical protein [Campylobacterales bacterium]
MNRLIVTLFLSVFLLNAEEFKEPQLNINSINGMDYVNTQDSSMDQAIGMVKGMIKDPKLRSLTGVKSLVVLQGSNRSYSEPFYQLVTEELISNLGRLDNFRINYFERTPKVLIEGSPTKLKITRALQKKIDEIAKLSAADGILLWDLFEHEGQMHFIARVIHAEQNSILWHYKTNEQFVKVDKLLQAELVKYKVPQTSYIGVGFDTHYISGGYKRTKVTASSDQEANYLMGLDVLYSTQSVVSPVFRFGVGGSFVGNFITDMPVNIINLYADLRFQLNDYVPPIYDTATGEIIQYRNHQEWMMGFSLGQTIVTGSERQAGWMYSAYGNLGISKSLEFNVGVKGYLDAKLEYADDKKYDKYLVPLGTSVFMGVKFKTNFEEEIE